MKIRCLICQIFLPILLGSIDGAVLAPNKDGKVLDLGGIEGQIKSNGRFVAKLSPCAGPYNDCCGLDPEQEQNPDVTFVYPSYLTQYFYVCVENAETVLEPEFFRCPFEVDDEGYHEGLFNADDLVGCYLAPPEAQRKKKTRTTGNGAGPRVVQPGDLK